MDLHKYLDDIHNNRINPLAEAKIDAEFKVTIIDFLNEQRSLIDEQRKYTSAIKYATWVMAIATVVIAICTYFQYDLSSKMAEQFRKSQAPELQVK